MSDSIIQAYSGTITYRVGVNYRGVVQQTCNTHSSVLQREHNADCSQRDSSNNHKVSPFYTTDPISFISIVFVYLFELYCIFQALPTYSPRTIISFFHCLLFVCVY